MPVSHQTLHSVFVATLCCLLLAACGGDSGDGGTTPPVDYATYQAQSAGLRATWDSIAVTDPATLPASGSATFSGVMLLDAQLGAGATSMAGALKLVAHFATDSITGTANNFVDDADIAMTGTLVISNGVLDRAANTAIEYTFSSLLAGTLAGGGETYVISADLSGGSSGWRNCWNRRNWIWHWLFVWRIYRGAVAASLVKPTPSKSQMFDPQA